MKKVNDYIGELLDFNGRLISDNNDDNAENTKRMLELHEKKGKPGYYKEKAEVCGNIAEVEDRIDLAGRILKLIDEFMNDYKKKYELK